MFFKKKTHEEIELEIEELRNKRLIQEQKVAFEQELQDEKDKLKELKLKEKGINSEKFLGFLKSFGESTTNTSKKKKRKPFKLI